MIRILEGYVVKFPYRGNTEKALFLDRSQAEQYAAKWHGTVEELYSLPKEVEVVDFEEAKIISVCQENQVLPPLSTTSETDC